MWTNNVNSNHNKKLKLYSSNIVNWGVVGTNESVRGEEGVECGVCGSNACT